MGFFPCGNVGFGRGLLAPSVVLAAFFGFAHHTLKSNWCFVAFSHPVGPSPPTQNPGFHLYSDQRRSCAVESVAEQARLYEKRAALFWSNVQITLYGVQGKN